jgi:cysteine-rich repeat protein
VSSAGVEATGASTAPFVSQDGGTVAFVSSAANLVTGDTNGRLDVFVRDRSSDTTERVSVASDGIQAAADSFAPALSADGSRVVFVSLAQNLVAGDTNGTFDVFVHDRATATTVRVSVATDGAQANGPSFAPRLSADGLMVVFHSQATNLVAGDTNGASDVFVHDIATGATERVSVGSMGEQGNFASTAGTLSSDGRYVAFNSDATNLVADDTNAVTDVFVHDRVTGATERVSVGSGGEGDRPSGFVDPPSLSADGNRVGFLSAATTLVPDDGNNVVDVFVRDRMAGTTQVLSVATDGSAANGASVLWTTLSADGRTAVFASLASNLVPGDTNSAQDIFVHTNTDTCGDGALQEGEECDDGAKVDGDCCSATCTFEAEGSSCSDGDLCTQVDACDGQGACVGDEPVVCDGETPACMSPAACDPSTGTCVSATMPDGSACEDGDACTVADACSGGACVSGEMDPEACADHSQCYKATPAWGSSSPRREWLLADAFGEAKYRVKHAVDLCTAVKVKYESSGDIVMPREVKAMHTCHHMQLLGTKPPQPSFVRRLVRIENRFGAEYLEVEEPETLCLPAGDKHVPASGVSYTCHDADATEPEDHSALARAAHSTNGSSRSVKLSDRYRSWGSSLLDPEMLCAPTRVAASGEVPGGAILVCYDVRYKVNQISHFFWPRRQRTVSTLGSGNVDLWRPKRLCVPSVLTDVWSAPED